MRTIDADALEDKAKRYSLGYYEEDQWAVPLEAIDEAPTIDAVSVVRCKECKYWIGHIADDDGFDGEDECRWRDSEAPNADDYCSYGERKESE